MKADLLELMPAGIEREMGADNYFSNLVGVV